MFQEQVLLDPMFEAPGSDIVDVIITDETVKGNKPAEYVRRPKDLVESSEDSSDSGYEDNNREVSIQN